MTSKFPARCRSFWLSAVILCSPVAALKADEFELFTYEIRGTTVEITNYPTSETGEVVIPSVIAGRAVTSIGEAAFRFCEGLDSVTIPASVTNIGASAFYLCGGLTAMTIPPNVTTIGDYAFQYCTKLTSIVIPASVTSVGDGAFQGCSLMGSITVAAGNPAYASSAGVLLNAAKTTVLFCPEGKSGAFTVPSTVTTIAETAFADCAGLTEVNIPSSVTNIGEYAFVGCGGLVNVSLGTGLTILPPGIFQDCGALTGVTIPQGVTVIEDSAFFGCSGLTSVILPASLTTIGIYAFSYCDGLPAIAFPSGLTTIGHHAFTNCIGLTGVGIPASVTSIDSFAFYACSGLTTAAFKGNAPSLGSSVFQNTAPGFVFHCLNGKTGYTQPTWNGYPVTVINDAAFPATIWLRTHGYNSNTALHGDPNGDGIDLRLAYALDLDPRRNLQGSLPVAVPAGNMLSLTFHATSPGLTYRVETSANLQAWTTTGVTQPAPGPDQRSTATVTRDVRRRFLRLTVE